jgi:hypothetical protein
MSHPWLPTNCKIHKHLPAAIFRMSFSDRERQRCQINAGWGPIGPVTKDTFLRSQIHSPDIPQVPDYQDS